MKDLYEILRRYEFNKTEPETLQQLIQNAIDKGDTARQELKNLATAAKKIASEAIDAKLITTRLYPTNQQSIPPMVGIDGSSQQVGGFGGKWYVPISCAIVKALNGDISNMEVEVTAGIEEIQQQEFQNVGADIAKLMMVVETKAINTWAQKAPLKSYVFLDGPIIDPPSERDTEYVNFRCAALRACLSKNIQVVGCVKRSFDKTFKTHVQKILSAKDDKLGTLVSQFSSDIHLVVFMLSFLARKMPPSNYLYSQIVPIEDNHVTQLYFKQGLRIYFTYLQRDIGSSPLRIEIAIPEEISEEEIPAFIQPTLDLCVTSTYPGYYVPLIVQMAHEKCNIRQGCAEVLFDEIMTRTRASEPLEQIVLSKMR